MGIVALWIVAAALAAPADREFPGRRIPVPSPPRSQFRVPRPCQPVDREIGIGPVYFAAAEDGGNLLVSTTPGTPAKTPVVEGKPTAFTFDEKGTPRTLHLTFAKDGAGRWVRFASEALRFAVAGEDIRLYDCDGDGRYGVPGRDGYTRGAGEYVIPMEERLVLGTRVLTVVRVDPDKPLLVGSFAPCAGTPCQAATTAILNDLRNPHGLPAVFLDEALSAGCTVHAKFLNSKGWAGPTSPYPRGDGAGGEAPEGIAAARGSMIGNAAPEQNFDHNWRSFNGRGDAGNPLLRRIGVNAEPRNIYVVHCRSEEATGSGAGDRPTAGFGAAEGSSAAVPDWPVFLPADGTDGHPARASDASGEPIPDIGRCGGPLIVFFPPGSRIEEFTGTLEVEAGGAAVAVHVPALSPLTYRKGIIPAAPLLAKTWYRATYRWSQQGIAGTRTIRFRTR